MALSLTYLHLVLQCFERRGISLSLLSLFEVHGLHSAVIEFNLKLVLLLFKQSLVRGKFIAVMRD